MSSDVVGDDTLATVTAVWLARVATVAYVGVGAFALHILWRADPLPAHAKLMRLDDDRGGQAAPPDLRRIDPLYQPMYSVSKGVLGMMLCALFATYSLLFSGPLSGPVHSPATVAAWWVAATVGLITYPWYVAIGIRTGKRWNENGYRWPTLALLHTAVLAASALASPLPGGWRAVVLAPLMSDADSALLPSRYVLWVWVGVVPAVALYCALRRTVVAVTARASHKT